MKRFCIALLFVLTLLLLAALPTTGQDCGFPGCSHYIPTRTPTPPVSPIGEPLLVARHSVFIPLIRGK